MKDRTDLTFFLKVEKGHTHVYIRGDEVDKTEAGGAKKSGSVNFYLLLLGCSREIGLVHMQPYSEGRYVQGTGLHSIHAPCSKGKARDMCKNEIRIINSCTLFQGKCKAQV